MLPGEDGRLLRFREHTTEQSAGLRHWKCPERRDQSKDPRCQNSETFLDIEKTVRRRMKGRGVDWEGLGNDQDQTGGLKGENKITKKKKAQYG